jgi:hypothetical protein
MAADSTEVKRRARSIPHERWRGSCLRLWRPCVRGGSVHARTFTVLRLARADLHLHLPTPDR